LRRRRIGRKYLHGLHSLESFLQIPDTSTRIDEGVVHSSIRLEANN
jgi:hypothetical protein